MSVPEPRAGASSAGRCGAAGAGRARGRGARCPLLAPRETLRPSGRAVPEPAPPAPRPRPSRAAASLWAFLPPGTGPRLNSAGAQRRAGRLTVGLGGVRPRRRPSRPPSRPLRRAGAPPPPPRRPRASAASHGGGSRAAALDGAPRRAERAAPRLAPPGPAAQLHGAGAAAAARRGGRLLQPPRLAGQPLLRQPGPRARARLLQPGARPPDRRPDVPAALAAQPGAALAGRGQGSPLRGRCAPPQPLDREPLLQDAPAPLGRRRPRRAPVRVPGGGGWGRGRQRLSGLPDPHRSPLGHPPLRLPAHAPQGSVSGPQHHRGHLAGLLLGRGECRPQGGRQGWHQVPGAAGREHEDGRRQPPAPEPGRHGHPACHSPPHPHLPLLRASCRPRLQQWALPPRRLPGWPGLQLHPEAAEQGPLLLRRPGVRQLRGHSHPSVAAGRHRALPVQRLRPLPQDERAEPAAHQAQAEAVGCQESRHLLRKLSDDDHHAVAPERQRGPRVQRLRPLLQAAQREQAADHEEGRHPDPEPEDVQQVQEEQEGVRVLRGAVQVCAGQGLPVQRRRPGGAHGACGPPAALQPLRSHPAHPDAHPPPLQPLLRPPPPIQHGDRHGLGTAPRTDRRTPGTALPGRGGPSAQLAGPPRDRGPGPPSWTRAASPVGALATTVKPLPGKPGCTHAGFPPRTVSVKDNSEETRVGEGHSGAAEKAGEQAEEFIWLRFLTRMGRLGSWGQVPRGQPACPALGAGLWGDLGPLCKRRTQLG